MPKYSDEQLADAIRDSVSWADVCRKIGIVPGTGGQTHVSKRAKQLNFDSSHFTGKTWSKDTISTLLLGKRFGKLVVTDFLGSSGQQTNEWLCACDCGSFIVAPTGRLNYGASRSCGCSKRDRITGPLSPGWTGCGEISKTHWGKIQDTARYRGLVFDISIEYAWDLFCRQCRCCALSGERLVMYAAKGDYETRTASLDRIDSKLGYLESNVQWVHKDINLMKMALDQTKFLAWCTTIHLHNT